MIEVDEYGDTWIVPTPEERLSDVLRWQLRG